MSASNDRVRERQPLGAALDELDPVREPGGLDALAPRGEHLRALVERRRRGSPVRRTSSIATAAVPVATSSTVVVRARPRSARRGTAASADPARARAAGSSGRTSGPSGAKRSRAARFRSEREATRRV